MTIEATWFSCRANFPILSSPVRVLLDQSLGAKWIMCTSCKASSIECSFESIWPKRLSHNPWNSAIVSRFYWRRTAELASILTFFRLSVSNLSALTVSTSIHLFLWSPGDSGSCLLERLWPILWRTCLPFPSHFGRSSCTLIQMDSSLLQVCPVHN